MYSLPQVKSWLKCRLLRRPLWTTTPSCTLIPSCLPLTLFHLSFVQRSCHLLAAPAHSLLHHSSLSPLDLRAGIFTSFVTIYGTQPVLDVQAKRGIREGPGP